MVTETDQAARIIDAMSVSWGKSPDYIAQRVDGWVRKGNTLAQIEAAFDQTEKRRVEAKVDDPVAYMHVTLRSLGSVGEMKSVTGAMFPAPPIEDTHDPNAQPPRMVWVRTNQPCNACELKRKGFRASQIVSVLHTCGEMKSYVEVNRPFIQARHEEAKVNGECRLCWGAGFRWSYEAQKQDVVYSGGRQVTFQDQRGIRKLIVCPSKRVNP